MYYSTGDPILDLILINASIRYIPKIIKGLYKEFKKRYLINIKFTIKKKSFDG